MGHGKKIGCMHTGGKMSECIHDGCFAEAEGVKEDILCFGGDEVVDVNRFGLRVTLNPALKLV